MYYVYEMINPVTNVPFYVGKGCGYRYLCHEKESKLDRTKWTNVGKCETVAALLAGGHAIQYQLHPYETEELAYQKERELIQTYGRVCNNTGVLLNLLPGGKGGRVIPVYVFSRHDGSFVGEFGSQAEASLALNISPATISEALHGRSISRRYVFSRTSAPPLEYVKDVRIDVYELPTKTLYGTYLSTHEVARAIGVSQTLVHNALTLKQKRILGKYVVVPHESMVGQHEIIERVDPITQQRVIYATLNDARLDTKVDRSGVLRSIKSNGTKMCASFLWYRLLV